MKAMKKERHENISETTSKQCSLKDMINIGEIGMLTLLSEDNSPSIRPMQTVNINDHNDLFFFGDFVGTTNKLLRKGVDSYLTFILETREEYFSMVGKANSVDDIYLVNMLWKDTYEQWVKGGLNNKDLVLIRFIPTSIDHWVGSQQGLEKFAHWLGKKIGNKSTKSFEHSTEPVNV